jgi:hypothetical protein
MRMPKTPMNTEMCFCPCVYMKSVRTIIIRQSNSIQNRQHTTRDSLGYQTSLGLQGHLITNFPQSMRLLIKIDSISIIHEEPFVFQVHKIL